MKKILALLVCIIILVSTLSVTCFAAEVTEGVPPQTEIEETSEKIVEGIVAWVQNHLEEISVIATLLLTIFYNVRKFATMNKSIGTLNNNAVTVAQDSAASIGSALLALSNVSDTVGTYTAEFNDLKDTIKNHLNDTTSRLDVCCKANIEFANELADLLVLANIPNAKKEELYSRHRAAVDAINNVKTDKTEVKGNVEEV